MFKEQFKRYKCKNASFVDVLDLHSGFTNDFEKENAPVNDTFPGLKPTQHWEIYTYKSNPGLIYIKNPFTPLGHRYWPIKCLKYYTHKPNKTNLDAHYPNEINNLIWPPFEAHRDQSLLQKLRWVTLGYHHNWDTKVYSDDSQSPFPSDLESLTKYFAKVLGFQPFHPQAAIVNYYQRNSTLSGHTDHSERNLRAPLFSLSFGQTSVFLLGGNTLEEKPISMLLKSGDVLVMSGGARLCYHGVPRILEANDKPWEYCEKYDGDVIEGSLDADVWENCLNASFWEPFGDYLKGNRINVNVRQVLLDGETKIT